jgi:hypothetical protein
MAADQRVGQRPMLSDKGKGPGGCGSAAIPRSGIWGYDRISRLIGSFGGIHLSLLPWRQLSSFRKVVLTVLRDRAHGRQSAASADNCNSCRYLGSKIISLSPRSTHTAKICCLLIFAVART